LAHDGSKVTVYWMLAAFLLLTISEVLVSTIGLELAFTAAPASMKSFVTGCFLLTVFIGDLLNILTSGVYEEKLSPGTFFTVMAVLMLVAAAIFLPIGRQFERNPAAA